MPSSRDVQQCIALKSHVHLIYLGRRAERHLGWLERTSLSSFLPQLGQSKASLEAVVLPLTLSRLLCASEIEALGVVARSFCQRLASCEVLVPLLRLCLDGLDTMSCLDAAAADLLQQVDVRQEAAHARLRSLAKADLVALRQEAAVHSYGGCPGKAVCTAVKPMPILELASMILQPGEKAHDDFAVQKLLQDATVAFKALAWRPEQLNTIRQKKIARLLAERREQCLFAAAASAGRGASQPICESTAVAASHLLRPSPRGNAAAAVGALAEWLLAVHQELEERPNVVGMQTAKLSVAAHIVPLARWCTRPHQKALLGRPMPPREPQGVGESLPEMFDALRRASARTAAPRAVSSSSAVSTVSGSQSRLAPCAVPFAAAPPAAVVPPNMVEPMPQAPLLHSSGYPSGASRRSSIASSCGSGAWSCHSSAPSTPEALSLRSAPSQGQGTGEGAAGLLARWLEQHGAAAPGNVGEPSKVPANKKGHRQSVSSCSTACSTDGEDRLFVHRMPPAAPPPLPGGPPRLAASSQGRPPLPS
eukprot:TRINITY_DN37752_c0_g1_i3.p1 TRINITY_DN37752_c0_g1~~TRINITY_DN37752_c0_g1_i3.p1  ORF type:complete len:535 (-),score=123.77 TRINITY_DN37752_c0_g1_i3:106-1710(-)